MAQAKQYSLSFKFNGEVINKKTDDIAVTIADVAPTVLLSEVYITAKKKGAKYELERKLNLTQGKRVFRDPIARQVFVNNLLFV